MGYVVPISVNPHRIRDQYLWCPPNAIADAHRHRLMPIDIALLSLRSGYRSELPHRLDGQLYPRSAGSQRAYTVEYPTPSQRTAYATVRKEQSSFRPSKRRCSNSIMSGGGSTRKRVWEPIGLGKPGFRCFLRTRSLPIAGSKDESLGPDVPWRFVAQHFAHRMIDSELA